MNAWQQDEPGSGNALPDDGVNTCATLFYKAVYQHLRYSAARLGHPGQRDHPSGRSQGSRRKLTDAFIRALARDWKAHGAEVIQRVREDNPVAYFKGMLSLVQKDVSVEGEIKQAPLYTEPLSATMAWIEQIVQENDNSSGANETDKNGSDTA